MFRFLMKGMLRDKHRCLMPTIVVTLGVFLTVGMFAYMKGVMGDMLNNTSRLESGHVKITSLAYRSEIDLLPNDLAMEDGPGMLAMLRQNYPDVSWSERIKFGGLLDAFDENRETRAQLGVGGIGIDLFGPDAADRERWNLQSGLRSGTLPQQPGDILMAEKLAGNMGVAVGEEVTLISATVNGSMSLQNFRVAGFIEFGIPPMDRSMILADLNDVKRMLDMGDWSSEILGYFPIPYYDDALAEALRDTFNVVHSDPVFMANDTLTFSANLDHDASIDRFAPYMMSMLDDSNMRDYYTYVDKAGSIISFVMIFAMGIVLWNTGLMGAIRRYAEMGLRLAVGESKGHVYRSLLVESIGIGVVGTVLGTIMGLGLGLYLQEVGLNMGDMMKDSTMMMPTIIRARITPTAFYIGFFPGVIATLLGAGLSGLRIYKRDTASLFKELET
ncbi:MAG: FtsX-like permease family protein [Candidatus Marinimicrobia bacterium]|nr:FtsX-like permease family protein [Candidatus Neomarinimicrobiota bacterium]